MTPLLQLGRVLALCSAVIFTPLAWPAQTAVRGTLPNGVQYLLVPLPQSSDVSLRLVVKSGSIDERAGEYGYAHFIEHLAFVETRDFPGGSLVQTLQRLGVAIGADLNAMTGSSFTAYQVDLGENQRDQLETALKVLRNYADGIQFTPAAVNQERGVILSERRTREVPMERVARGIRSAIYAETPLATHEPIGTVETIEAATPEQLAAVYARLYRPDRMTVIIVGNIDAVQGEAKLRDAFASIPAREPEPVRPTIMPPAGSRRYVAQYPVDSQVAIASLISTLRREGDTAESRRLARRQALAVDLLDRRLKNRRAATPGQFVQVGAGLNPGPTAWVDHADIQVQGPAIRWEATLDLAQVELRRALTFGFTDVEFAEARTAHLVTLRNMVETISQRQARPIAQQIVRSVARDRTWQPPADALAEAEADLATMTPADLIPALAALFPAENTQAVVLMPEKFRLPTTDDVAEVIEKARNRRVRDYSKDEGPLTFAYESFDKPGTIAERKTVAELRLDQIRLSNDVRVNLLPMTSQTGRFYLSARLGRGTADVPPDRPGISRAAAAIFETASLGRHPGDEFDRLLDLRGVTQTMTVVDDQGVITLEGPSSELVFALKLLTAQLSDLRFGPESWSSVLGRYLGLRRSTFSTPSGVAWVNATPLLANQDRRMSYPAAEYIAQYPYREVADWLRGNWLRGPLEIGIVGHFLPDTVIDPLRETVGTLPRRRDGEIKAKERITPTAQPGRIQVPFEGEAGNTASIVQWPLTAATTPRQRAATVLASDILEDRLRRLLREKFGATYSPTTGIYRHATQRDHAAAWVALTLAPNEDQNMTGWAMFVADELARNGTSEDEFLRAAAPRRTARAREDENPRWWLENLASRAQQDPLAVNHALARSTAWDEVTLTDVNTAARQFAKERVLVVIVAPGPAKPASAK